MEPKSIRDRIISKGVANIIATGYTNCNRDNILIESVYKSLFHWMLKIEIQNSRDGVKKQIEKLLEETK